MALVCSDMIYSSYVSAYQSHEPVRRSCVKHYLQGVWGAYNAGYPLGGGEREGRSPLACATAHMPRPQLEGAGRNVYAILKSLA